MKRESIPGLAVVMILLLAANSNAAQLKFQTLLGGAGKDSALRTAIDGEGCIYLLGFSDSAGWISGGYDASLGGSGDVFVMKLNPEGEPIWSSYLGGEGHESPGGIAVGVAGNVLVAGQTDSPGWVSGGYDTTFNSVGTGPNEIDCFLVKLSPSGGHLWSTYIGGVKTEVANGVAVGADGGVAVTGSTTSGEWVQGGLDTTLNGDTDAFVVKISAAGEHIWSTLLGGPGVEITGGVAIDGQFNMVVAGKTNNEGAWLETGGVFDEGFIYKLSSSGGHVWSRGVPSECNGVAIDSDNNIGICGTTFFPDWASGGYDTVLNFQGTYTSKADAYAMKLDANGTILWSSYLGGSNHEFAASIAFGTLNCLYVGGATFSWEGIYSWYPKWVLGGFDTTFGGGEDETIQDGFVAKLSPDGQHLWTSYVGGTGEDSVGGVAANTKGDLSIVGSTQSSGWIGNQAVQGESDAFAIKLVEWTYSVRVNVQPSGLAEAGWRISRGYVGNLSGGTGGWHLPGERIFYVNPSDQPIALVLFKPVAGYMVPEPIFVNATHGAQSVIQGTYQVASRSAMHWATDLAGGMLYGSKGIALDADGNIYITGQTDNPGWYTPGADGGLSGRTDAFLIKLSSDGAALWSTYMGGENDEAGRGVAVNSEGDVYVAGWTDSPGWEVSGPHGDESYNGGEEDGFLVKFNSAGQIQWSSFLGGNQRDVIEGIACDSMGNAIVAGGTNSTNMWVTGGYDTTPGGNFDGFVAAFSPAGKRLWATYLGGAEEDWANAVTVDSTNAIFAVGRTRSLGWVFGGADTTLDGQSDAFIVKLAANGGHVWSSYYGGSASGNFNAVVVGPANNPIAAGGSFSRLDEGPDNSGSIAKFSGAGALLWGKSWQNLHGDYDITEINGLAVDSAGFIYFTGATNGWGHIAGGFDTTSIHKGDDTDGFIAKFDPTGEHVWSSYLLGLEAGGAIALDEQGRIVVAGKIGTGYDALTREFAVGSTAIKNHTGGFVARIGAPGKNSAGEWLVYD